MINTAVSRTPKSNYRKLICDLHSKSKKSWSGPPPLRKLLFSCLVLIKTKIRQFKCEERLKSFKTFCTSILSSLSAPFGYFIVKSFTCLSLLVELCILISFFYLQSDNKTRTKISDQWHSFCGNEDHLERWPCTELSTVKSCSDGWPAWSLEDDPKLCSRTLWRFVTMQKSECRQNACMRKTMMIPTAHWFVIKRIIQMGWQSSKVNIKNKCNQPINIEFLTKTIRGNPWLFRSSEE